MAIDRGTADLDQSLRQAVDDWMVTELARQRRELHLLREMLRGTGEAPGEPRPAPQPASQAAQDARWVEVSRRLDFLASELSQRLDDQSRRMDALSAALNQRLDQINGRVDDLHGRLGRLGEVAVRRDEHVQQQARHDRLERAVESLRDRLLGHGSAPIR